MHHTIPLLYFHMVTHRHLYTWTTHRKCVHCIRPRMEWSTLIHNCACCLIFQAFPPHLCWNLCREMYALLSKPTAWYQFSGKMIMEHSLIICQYHERLFFFGIRGCKWKEKIKMTSTDFFQAIDYLLISVDLAGLATHFLDKNYHRPDSVLGKMPVR